MASKLITDRPKVDRSAYIQKSKTLEGHHPPPSPPLKGVGGEGGLPQQAASGVVEKLILELKLLDSSQRKQVHDYLHLLDKEATEAKDPHNRHLLIFGECLRSEIAGHLGTSPAPLSVNTDTIKRLHIAFKSVQQLLNAANWTPKDSGEASVVYGQLAHILVLGVKKWSSKAEVPLSLRLVLDQADKLPSYFDFYFPGYLASGIASAAFNRWVYFSKHPIKETNHVRQEPSA